MHTGKALMALTMAPRAPERFDTPPGQM
jgi:hypothetical protein